MIKPLFQNVVVAVNGSDSSIKAAMYAIMMARLYRSNIKFVYVVDTATIRRLTLSHFLVSEESASYEKNLTSDGQKYIDYVLNLAKSKGIKAQGEVRTGSIWLEIVNCADDFKADVIIMGGGTGRTVSSMGAQENHLMYSQTYKDVISHANCSVLVINKQNIEQLFKIS